MADPLRTLLDLPEQEKASAGWSIRRAKSGSSRHLEEDLRALPGPCAELNDVLRRAGIGRGSTSSPTVYLVGAGTSDYTGRALAPLLRRRWGCDVWPIPSTTLLTEFEESTVREESISGFRFPARGRVRRAWRCWSRRSIGIARSGIW